MAKSKSTEPEQLALIEVEPENAKKIKSLIRRRTTIKKEQKELRTKLAETEMAIIDEVKATGATPDANGAWRVKVGEEIISVAPRKAELKIVEENNDAPDPDEADEEGNEPAPQSRSR